MNKIASELKKMTMVFPENISADARQSYYRDIMLFAEWIEESIPQHFEPAIHSISNLISHYLSFISGNNVIIPIIRASWWAKILIFFRLLKPKMVLIQPEKCFAQATIARKKTSLNYLLHISNQRPILQSKRKRTKRKKLDPVAKSKIEQLNIHRKDYLFYFLTFRIGLNLKDLQNLRYGDIRADDYDDKSFQLLWRLGEHHEYVFPISARALSKKLLAFQQKYGLAEYQANWKQLQYYRAKIPSDVTNSYISQ